jgi:hypothetical protein
MVGWCDGSVESRVGGGDEEFWSFPRLDLFLGDTGPSERFLPWRGAHWCAECPGSGFAGYDGYVGTCVWGGGYLREVDHVVYWWKVLALAN